MNVCLLYYDGFWGYEVGLALNRLQEHNLFSTALEERVYQNEVRQKLLPDCTLDRLDPRAVDLFILPGGDGIGLAGRPDLQRFLASLHQRQVLIAGICCGTALMASCGLLDGKRCTGGGAGISPDHPYRHFFDRAILTPGDVVVDGNLITATGNGYVAFAETLERMVKNDLPE